MPAPPGRPAQVTSHPGSSAAEIDSEPDWGSGHQHRVGFVNADGRRAGLTHDGDFEVNTEDERRFVEEAMRKYRETRERTKEGDLVNFDQVMQAQTDYSRHRPDVYPPGWRFVVRTTEDEIKKQPWPANKQKEAKEKEAKQQKEKEQEDRKVQQDQKDQQDQATNGDAQKDSKQEDADPEHQWRRSTGRDAHKHNDAYGKEKVDAAQASTNGTRKDDEDGHKSEYEKLREKYSVEEIALLQSLQHEAEHMKNLKENPGNLKSPVARQSHQDFDVSIDGADAMTPDNWIPRSATLIRRTGQHPLNAEPKLASLFDAGLVTPNPLHYVRNHGSVPRLYWGEHVLDVCDGGLRLSMDDLNGSKWRKINIQVALACDGNRRGELNTIKKGKGFDWGSGALGCAFWKGVLVADVLKAAGVTVEQSEHRRWVNFEGVDQPSEGKYATSFPLEFVMDPCNDVILALEMNDEPLPPDHGFPIRLIVPGYVGGRSIKWLGRIWVTDHENDSYYHIWDNRVLPEFVTEKDGDFARTMFNHPSTACMEQNLNSVIVKPAQGEKIQLEEALHQKTYRVEGYAYDGGGHEVQKVEVSIDGGNTWLYCMRKFPDRPLRHGYKYWTWVHWSIEIDMAHFIRAESITVRCFNVFKNTQPETPVWNLMGMMNNGCYIVKASVDQQGTLVYRHPYDQEGTQGGGWMTPSIENQLAAAQQDSGVPSKEFTREEIEKHNAKNDAWLVINGNVYDVTSVLDWHPGGTAAILANAGKLDLEVTSSFENVHDEYAHKKLAECAIGKATEKAKKYMQQQAQAAASKAAAAETTSNVLNTKRWSPVTLVSRSQISDDTFTYTFQYEKGTKLNLGTCQHIQFGIHMLDKMLIRSYTPTSPVRESDDADGTFTLTVKTYFPDKNQPGGAFTNMLHDLNEGEQVDVCGPTGEITYLGKGKFNIEGKEQVFRKVSLVLGGSGITPGFSLIKRVVEDGGDDELEIAVVDANKTEKDILLRDELNKLVQKSTGKLTVTHVLSHPEDKEGWEKRGGLSGHVDAEVIKKSLFPPGDGSIVFLCGPPGMIQKAALPALKDWGYEEDKDCFGF